MDFTPEISAFQGAVVSVDNVHSFSRLSSRGGNEEKIEFVVSSLKRFLKERQCIKGGGVVQDVVTMRKYTLLLVLNADFRALEEMVNKDGIDMVIGTLPTIPKVLLSEMIWSLHMDHFVCEIIAFGYPPLALQIVTALVDHFKHFSPSDYLHKLEIITLALYRLICRLHFFNFEGNVLTNIATSAFNNFSQCINYFVEPPNAWKLTSLSTDDQFIFKGKCLQTMLHLIQGCMQQFTSELKFVTKGFDELYQLTYCVEVNNNEDCTVCESTNAAIMDCLVKCNEAILDKCKDLVMDVNINIFCAWSEFEENGKTMQDVIGELGYRVRGQLMSITSISEHPVIEMIKHICKKPKDIQEVVNTADLQTIIENLNKGEEVRAQWVRALINRDQLCQDASLVRYLMPHTYILNEVDSLKLYNTCKNHLKEFPQSPDVEILAAKAFQFCSTPAKQEILEERFHDKCFYDMRATPELNDDMTETFNRLISKDNTEFTEVHNLFLQSPQMVLTKIFELAVESSQQTQIMVKVMGVLKPFSSHYYTNDTEPCVIRVAKTVLDKCLNSEPKQLNAVKFISALKNNEIIPGVKLLMLIIMPNLHKGLLSRNVPLINIQCRLLAASFSMNELVAYRAALLAMFAQVLDVLRWRINTFVLMAPSTLELALEIQDDLINTYHDHKIPEKEGEWLRSKLRNIQPLNMYYYKCFYDNIPSNNFVEVVSGKRVHRGMVTEQLTIWLSQIICTTTQNEWCVIWDSLSCFGDSKTLDIIHDALCLVSLAEAVNRSQYTWECLMYCFRNFVYVMRYKFYTEPLTEDAITAVIDKISSTANIMKEDNTDDVFAVFLPIFVYMVERKNDYTINVVNLLCCKLNNPKFFVLASKVLNGTAEECMQES